MNTKTALITGANRGIGLEICKQLLDRDINILLGSRDIDKGLKAKSKLSNSHVEVIKLDVTSNKDIDNLSYLIEENEIKIDILVNNAGIANGIRYSVLNEPESISRKTMETNFWGAWKISRLVIPKMKKNNFGRIVNISSGHSLFSVIDKQNPSYRISKTSLNALTIMLANEVENKNILVNAMTPGWVRTHLGGINATRSVEKGAETAVNLCLADDNGPRGGFFKDGELLPW